MAETFYRLKSAGGGWNRATGVSPIAVSGLVSASPYEYLKGGGSIGEVLSGSGAAGVITRASVVADVAGVGRTSAAALKMPGVDTLPAGATARVSAGGFLTIEVTGDDVVLDGWFANRVTGPGLNLTIRQCELVDPGWVAPTAVITGNGDGWTIEDSNLFGTDMPSGGSAIVVNNGHGLTLRRNVISKFSSDGIKNAANDILIERNLFTSPAPLPPAWDTGAAYSAGEFVTWVGAPWEAILATVAGEEPGISAKWKIHSPHLDILSLNGGSGIVRYNHFPFTPYAFRGATQMIRIVRDTGKFNSIGPYQVYGNVFEDWPNIPLAVGAVRDFTTPGGGYSPGGFAGANGIFYRALVSTTTDPAIDETDWVEDRDLGAVEDVLFAYNWIEGTGLIFNGTSHRLSLGVNYDLNGAEFFPAGDAALPQGIPIPAPRAALLYTAPTQFGPSQKFTITPTAYGTAKRGGVMYRDAVAIRAGIEIVAVIQLVDGTQYWTTMTNSGVTIEDNLDGSFTMRIYDSNGDPMQATIDIPAGAATVVVEADEVATSTAKWGNSPFATNFVSVVNAVPDPGFDNPSFWTAAAGLSVTGGVLRYNSPVASASVQTTGSGVVPVTESTQYFLFFDVVRLDAVGKRMRLEVNGVRIPASTITISEMGTKGPFQFTTGAGVTTANVKFSAIDGGMQMDLDNLVIRPV